MTYAIDDGMEPLYGKYWAVVGFRVNTPRGPVDVNLTDAEKAVFSEWDGGPEDGLDSICRAVRARAKD